ELSSILAEVVFLQQHIHVHSEQAVRRWSDVDCNDYQLTVALIVGLLSHPELKDAICLRCEPEYRAMSDIIRNSNVGQLLEVDDKQIRFRTTISKDLRAEVSRKLLSDHSDIIAN